MRNKWIVLVALSMTGCAGLAPMETSSGRPEVVINGVSKKAVQEYIAGKVTQAGYTIKSANDYQLVYGRPAKGMLASMAFGTSINMTPEERYIISTTEMNGGVLVTASSYMVTNPGSAYEKSDDITVGDVAKGLQNGLDRVKSSLEK